MSWRRLKVSNCRVSPAARSAACAICCAERAPLLVQFRGRQQRGVAVNDGENVVEIVRDAAGELADGLHFLRLAQLLLQPFLGGRRHGTGSTSAAGGPAPR